MSYVPSFELASHGKANSKHFSWPKCVDSCEKGRELLLDLTLVLCGAHQNLFIPPCPCEATRTDSAG